MTIDEFKEILKASIFPFAEAEFKKAVQPPFLVCLKGIDKSIYANGIAVINNFECDLELYTEKDDNKSEQELKDFLLKNNINFKMTERVWISSENFYLTAFKVLLYG